MDNLVIIDVAKETLMLLFKLSFPLLIVALVVGSLISLIQALTQIQEPTLAFVPKFISVMVTLLLLMPYIGNSMTVFFEQISSIIINLE